MVDHFKAINDRLDTMQKGFDKKIGEVLSVLADLKKSVDAISAREHDPYKDGPEFQNDNTCKKDETGFKCDDSYRQMQHGHDLKDDDVIHTTFERGNSSKYTTGFEVEDDEEKDGDELNLSLVQASEGKNEEKNRPEKNIPAAQVIEEKDGEKENVNTMQLSGEKHEEICEAVEHLSTVQVSEKKEEDGNNEHLSTVQVSEENEREKS